LVKKALLTISFALIVVALTAARPASTWGPLLRDFEAYWSAGQTYNAHEDPYGRRIWSAERSVPGVDEHQEEVLPFIGPPATLWLWSTLARLPYAIASTIWWLVLAGALGTLIAISLRASGAGLSLFSFLAALALAVGCGPVTGDLALGQVAMIALAGAVGSVEGTLLTKILGCFLASFQPNVSLGLISQLGFNRTTLAIVVGAVLSYLAGALAVGWRWPVMYAALVRSHAAGERYSGIQITPASIAYGFHASTTVTSIVAIVSAAAAIVAGTLIWRSVSDRFARFAAFSALTPFVVTFVHEHDLVAAFPAAIWCAVRTQGALRVLALFGTMLVAIDWFGQAQRPNGIAQAALLAAAALAAFGALGEEPEIGAVLRAAVPIVALFAAMAAMATAYPAPIWPYHLGAFHPPPSWSIATVWQQEQQRDGLQAAVPSWSVLRSLSLLGCALLALAICRHPSYCRTASRRSDDSS
jgi:hypothetical protein